MKDFEEIFDKYIYRISIYFNIVLTWHIGEDKLDNIKKNNIRTFPIEELSASIGGCAPSKIINYDPNRIAFLLLTSGKSDAVSMFSISTNKFG